MSTSSKFKEVLLNPQRNCVRSITIIVSWLGAMLPSLSQAKKLPTGSAVEKQQCREVCFRIIQDTKHTPLWISELSSCR